MPFRAAAMLAGASLILFAGFAPPPAGGVDVASRAHGPSIHVHTRGTRSRW